MGKEIQIAYTEVAIKQMVEASHLVGTIGFVPTMGALHKGHISLVEKAASENKSVVVSIFVNPTQFNDKNDLERYPRNLQADLELLGPSGCNIVFAPSVNEIYPKPDSRVFDFGLLGKVMEGEFRPGHFNGVAQVVSRLFDLVTPDKAYFGMKDFQQLAIIREMTRMLGYPVVIVPCPIVREADGLAMSSRNALLGNDERQNAPLIYRTLLKARSIGRSVTTTELKAMVIEEINQNSFLRVEYFELVDELTLQPVTSWDHPGVVAGCIAVWCGKVRLIDNIFFN